ncbi:MAG: acylphosphatase, partial [Actinomycetota bacterium]|nr:acylphosphatase [Actinomycetota bacterium]
MAVSVDRSDIRQPAGTGRARRQFRVEGVVQGVGFRPFVYALARELGLSGSVGNTGDGVLIEVEGDPAALDQFGARLGADAPPLARVERIGCEELACVGGTGFTIEDSRGTGGRTLVSPDIAT